MASGGGGADAHGPRDPRTDDFRGRRWIWELAATLLVAVVLVWAAAQWYEPPIESLLNAALGPASGGLYAVRIGSASVSLLDRSVSVSGLELSVVPEILARARLSGRGPRLQPRVRIEQFRIRGVRLLPLLRQRALLADSIEVDAPSVDLTLTLGANGPAQPADSSAEAPSEGTEPSPDLTFVERARADPAA